MDTQDSTALLRDIREEVISLLFNRHVFRTHQEIVRLNPNLRGRPHGLFSKWAQIVYAQAAAVGVRRLAGQNPGHGDVSLVGFLESLLRDPGGIWKALVEHYSEDAARAREALEKRAPLQKGWEASACKRLLSQDRKTLISAAQKTVHFASKRVAHSVPRVPASATFSDLDEAIDTLKAMTEKYTRLSFARTPKDLDQEMRGRWLQDGWKEIFLEPWASGEDIGRPLGEMRPPERETPGD